MASLTQAMRYSYYPYASGSVEVEHAGRAAADDGRGSFGPVLLVLAVISFLTMAACVAGRLCGRGASPRGEKTTSEQQGAEADKGSGAKHLEVMRPLPSSRATVHDVDDAFEIKFVPKKPGGWEPASGGGIRLQALPLPQTQLVAAPPRQHPAAPIGAAGFRAPASGSGMSPFPPAQQRR